jgi:hypothetical protein
MALDCLLLSVQWRGGTRRRGDENMNAHVLAYYRRLAIVGVTMDAIAPQFRAEAAHARRRLRELLGTDSAGHVGCQGRGHCSCGRAACMAAHDGPRDYLAAHKCAGCVPESAGGGCFRRLRHGGALVSDPRKQSMKHGCQAGCGRAFPSMETAERHEARCKGRPPKRNTATLLGADLRSFKLPDGGMLVENAHGALYRWCAVEAQGAEPVAVLEVYGASSDGQVQVPLRTFLREFTPFDAVPK